MKHYLDQKTAAGFCQSRTVAGDYGSLSQVDPIDGELGEKQAARHDGRDADGADAGPREADLSLNSGGAERPSRSAASPYDALGAGPATAQAARCETKTVTLSPIA